MTPNSADVPPAAGLRVSRVVGDDVVMVLDNTLDAIEAGRVRMEQHLAAEALGPRAVNRLEVVFEELIANVVRHGFDDLSNHSILVVAGLRPGEIRLTIEDDGQPFDPFELPEPPPFESLETAKIGGLGVPVVRRFSASTRYERAPPSEFWSDFVSRDGRPANRVTVTIATGA
jgi:anti-sigma regulatory factor (Ser/Thr protein kinase)